MTKKTEVKSVESVPLIEPIFLEVIAKLVEMKWQFTVNNYMYYNGSEHLARHLVQADLGKDIRFILFAMNNAEPLIREDQVEDLAAILAELETW